MNVMGVHPPGFLNIDSDRLANDFRDFKQSWENFVLAAKIGEKSDAVKVALLKNFLGTGAVKILNTLLAPENQNTPAAVLTALEGYCLPQSNETYERFLFNTATQNPNEDINQFVSKVRSLAATCNYGDLKDSLIRDRIVVGVRSDDTRKALLKTANLTLAMAIDTCRAQKLVEDRVTTMKIKEESTEADKYSEVIAKVRAADWSGSCKYCGRRDHRIGDRERCPANGATCRRTFDELEKKINKVKIVDEEENSNDSDYITSVEEVNVVEKKMTTEVKFAINKHEEPKGVRCQIDTGASCNVITRYELSQLTKSEVELKPSGTKLKGFGGQVVPAVGRVVLRHKNGDKCSKVVFQVVDLSPKVLQMPLLGYNTCVALGIISVHKINECKVEENSNEEGHNPECETIIKKFRDVFSGDGRFKQQEPRRVPVSLRQKLQHELEDLEKRGIIEKVEEFTEWTSNVVLVVRNDKVRICLDPVQLNQAIKRPRLQMSTLEEILPELHNVKVFSTLDVRIGFWHVQLTDKSSRITAFWTQFGRYIWKRLPFGLSCSPETFQQKLQQALQGLNGIEVLVDDILIVGRGNTESEAAKDHNRNLIALLQRCRDFGIKLSKAK
ncbi:uncharacterized protein K02A2.6-like [Wyeomyia smithii]|uniref:uncharacterized protein K02A2.6-like n=1 Tax=Wyeomyia smithii TaxID=174621 RepID=UPI002467BA4F|nr:uncharacterized protein K02A2.6-like [Wyeomyia smithii]